MPLWNRQGMPTGASYSSEPCKGTGATKRCIYQLWPAGFSLNEGWRMAFANQLDLALRYWHGSLLEDKRDGSGLLYRRHRYYDTRTGRFTQEDPIGLAG